MFIRNAWCAACTADELGPAKPLGPQVCGERMVFFRRPDGPNSHLAALEDWCPHRGAPLSPGRVSEGMVICGHHGLQMGCDGRTVGMPGQCLLGAPSIRRVPAVEHGGFVRVWPADAARADAAALPQLPWVEDSHCTCGGGLYRIDCDYRLMIDNLMDLWHETCVHADSIGQQEIDESPVATDVDGEHVRTSRFMAGIHSAQPQRGLLRLNIDACGVQARRVIERRLAAEQATMAAA